jgi:indolepyruvate ferredoxin oxidoreductase
MLPRTETRFIFEGIPLEMSEAVDRQYRLEDRYARESGRVYLTGVQALVRLPMDQRRRDLAAGLNTAGFISGYRGSPLGTYDLALWQGREMLEQHQVHFEPGVNEDLAATAVWGSQQANLLEGPRYDGVFAIWYGKGPGVDRSCDALKHGNYAGAAAKGGVLVLTGDDPGAKSSSIAHQSEHALIHCGIPVLNPSSVQEYLDLGLLGWAMSRYAGLWVGFKCLTDTVDSAASVEVGPGRVQIRTPDDFAPPAGLHIGWQNYPLQVEARLYQQRIPAAQAFARANGIDRVAMGGDRRRLGIVTAGKAYLDVRQALEELGVDDAAAAEHGLAIYKVGMTWPLEPQNALRFCDGLEDVLVVEEKRPVIEDQLARLLYNRDRRPRLAGKRDESGAPMIPAEGELAPGIVAAALRAWLERRAPELARRLRPPPPPAIPMAPGLMRLPSFCSGCPHNTSTVVPEGSLAQGGIGCHGMAVWLPDRRTLAVTQMGAEGANWIGSAPFTSLPHIFQNMGDGTYFHSGLLAIRAAVAAGVNITYKILLNGAVAMTGGQPIEGEPMDGAVTAPEVARQLSAEGVKTIAVLSDDPDKYAAGSFPAGVEVHHRDELDRVQKRLREVSGVSALVYDQTCAAEARRLRKRGALPEPDRRVVIHEGVCEGCGDCSVQSNCISIEPVETELGRKRRINQSSCNKDYSCLKGYCPSFLTIEGGSVRKASREGATADAARFDALPLPALPPLDRPWNVLVTGIGGSGVVTVGAILAVAAHLEGKGCSELDVTGLAQKNGAVSSHVRIARDAAEIHATRIAAGSADLLIACDLVVATSPENLPRLGAGRSTAVVNTDVAPTADFASRPDLDLRPDAMEDTIRNAAGADATHFLPATRLATALQGDALATNLFLLGYAFQLGRVPVSLAALLRAIELNGRAAEWNQRAFAWGRLAAHDRAAVEAAARPLMHGLAPETGAETFESIVARRVELLTAYQSAAWAERYRATVERVAARERALGDGRDDLARAVARYLYKVMAYKDEYEVARLYTDGSLARQLDREFEGSYKLRVHLSPQFLPGFLAPRDPDTGRVKKWAIPAPLMLAGFRIMAALRFLRGTPFDPFGWTAHRRIERGLIGEYEKTVAELCAGLTAENRPLAVEIASLPEIVRGYDTVKERTLAEAKHKEQELLAAFRRTL